MSSILHIYVLTKRQNLEELLKFGQDNRSDENQLPQNSNAHFRIIHGFFHFIYPT